MNTARPWRFAKMHGAGNDFVLIDLRGGVAPPDSAVIRAMADRHTGIGFDQLLSIEDSHRGDCLARYRIWNSDGSPAQQCGNGARCVAAWLHRAGASGDASFVLDSPAGVIAVQRLDSGDYALAMGRPAFSPAQIPLLSADEADRYTLDLPSGPVQFGAVSMGNPHAVIEVADLRHTPVATIAAALQARPEFPEGVNVGFAEVVSPEHLRLRVYERGVGETLACGSGACAAVAVLVRQGRIGRQVSVDLPGGRLHIEWPDDGAAVRMAGPAAFVFYGEYFA